MASGYPFQLANLGVDLNQVPSFRRAGDENPPL